MKKQPKSFEKKKNKRSEKVIILPAANPQEYIQNGIILTLAVIISLFSLHKALAELSVYIPISDELANIFAVQSISLKGTPHFMEIKSYVNFDPGFPYYQKYFWYAPELYLRYPFYVFSALLPWFWGTVSNLFYLYLTMVVLIIFSWKKNTKIPVIPASILILLIGYSTWASNSFHYVRYYPFSLLSLMICHFCCSYLFTFPGISLVKRRLLVLIIAFVPYLFHQINLLYLLLWVGIIGWKMVKEKTYTSVYKRKILSITIVGILLTAITLLVYIVFKQALVLIHFDFNVQPTLSKFVALNFNTSPSGILITILIILFGSLSLKQLSLYEKNLLYFAIVFFMLSLLIMAPLMGGNYTQYNGANRYYFIQHLFYLVTLALFITAIYKNINRLIPDFYAKQIIVFILVCTPLFLKAFTLNNLNKENYTFSILPRIYQSEINRIKKETKDMDYIIVTSNNEFSIYNFPERTSYVFDSYPDSLNSKSDGKYGEFVKYKGNVMYTMGYRLVGTRSSFCKMVQETTHENILFLFINPYHTEPGLWSELEKRNINEGKMVNLHELQNICHQ